MEKLDDFDFLKGIDKSRMGEILINFPQQCEEAVKIGQDFKISPPPFPPPSRVSVRTNKWLPQATATNARESVSGQKRIKEGDVNKILVIGMGGSAIGGDLLKSYLFEELDIPFIVNRNYKIPHFITRDTLVFVSSYSGNTEETLSAYQEADKRGAKIIGLTSGGKLKEYCQRDGNPVVIIPSGFPPRTALGYLFFPLLIILERLGLIRSKMEEIEETIKILRKLSQELGPREKGNKAKRLAQELYNKVPVVYASHYFEAVALRWKDQFNENSKVFAIWNLFPEMNHNEIVGWEILEEVTKNFAIVLLRDKDDFKRIKARMDITKSIIEKKVSGIREVWSEGNSLLARIFSLIYLGDFISFYLALLNRVDPTPVKMIDLLKRELAKKRE